MLSERFTQAVDYAREAHCSQVRKGTTIPYLAHLLGVASMVLEHDGDEDQAIAGLLHDVVEDQGSHHEALIRKQFGERVADIVMGCTDGTRESKRAVNTPEARLRDWTERKRAYLAHLQQAPQDMLLVSACDKLYNARSILADLRNPTVGIKVFDRFTGKRDGTLWYYRGIAGALADRGSPLAPTIAATVADMETAATGGQPAGGQP